MTPVGTDRLPEAYLQRENRYRMVIIALSGLLVVTAFLAVWQLQGKNSAEDDRKKAEAANASYAAGPDAQAAAEHILGEMISYNYKTIRHEYIWTKFLANGDLRKDYERHIVPRFRKVIVRTKAAAQGKVSQSAYNIVDENKVNVLAFIRQRLTDVDNRHGVVAEQWASLTMTRNDEDSDWLISDIDIVSVPPPS